MDGLPGEALWDPWRGFCSEVATKQELGVTASEANPIGAHSARTSKHRYGSGESKSCVFQVLQTDY